MSKPLLLLACSQTKEPYVCAAELHYTGRLFRWGLKVADKFDYPVLILSAELGWIRRDTIVSPYDTKFTKPYDGPWPGGHGFYLGGEFYFGRCPSRFKEIVRHSGGCGRGGCGHIFHRLKQLLET